MEIVKHSQTRWASTGIVMSPAAHDSPVLVNAGATERSATVGGLMQVMWSKKWQLALFIIMGMVAGCAVSLVQSTLYTARTTIAPEQISENYSLSPGLSPSHSTAEDIYLMSQERVLNSDTLARRVVLKLDLASKNGFRTVPGRLDKVGRRLGWKALQSPSGAESLLLHFHKAVTLQTLPRAQTIDIACRTPDPQLSADVCNALVEEYANSSLESRQQENETTTRLLSQQLEALHEKLQRSGNELQRFASETGIRFDAENKEIVADEATLQLQAELSRAQADRILKQAQVAPVQGGSAASMPQLQDNPTLQEYQSKLMTLRRELAELSATYKPNHYKVVEKQAEINEVQDAMRGQQDIVLSRLRREYAIAKEREHMLAESYAIKTKSNVAQAEKITAYNLLKREADTTQSLYDSISQKVNEETMLLALKATNVQVIDAARPPSSPSSPNLPLNSAVGLLGGWVFGIGLVLLKAGNDQRVVLPGQISNLFHVSELGVIPSANLPAIQRLQNNRFPFSKSTLALVTWNAAGSLLADSFRTALASLLLRINEDERTLVFVAVSANPGEGKTTVVSNLAIALAAVGRRVLLVDADLRHPSLHQVFAVSNDAGLAEILQATEPVQVVATRVAPIATRIPGLSLLPSGPTVPGNSGVIFSARVNEMFAFYRTQFDTVLVDSPPVGLFADARVVAAASDGVVLIVRSSQTTEDDLRAVFQTLAEDRIKVVGAILNDWRPKASAGKYGAYANYQ
jgi:polysaccharide biosynthesis transport protein